jgi:hypothetical protein
MRAHPSAAQLVDYLARDEADGPALEDHLFACDDCAQRLSELAATADAVANAVAGGKVRAVGTDALIARLEERGVRLRHYRVEPGGRIECAVAADDVFVVAHYGADFGGVAQVDVVVTDDAGAVLARMERVPVPPDARSLPVLIRGDFLRRTAGGDHHVRLLAAEREVARYTFAHTAFSG